MIILISIITIIVIFHLNNFSIFLEFIFLIHIINISNHVYFANHYLSFTDVLVLMLFDFIIFVTIDIFYQNINIMFII